MKIGWLAIGLGLLVIAQDPALARPRHRVAVPPTCAPRARPLAVEGFLFNPRPTWNGCAPPVYEYGQYVGQDPDPNIRAQLRRDPATGYSSELLR